MLQLQAQNAVTAVTGEAAGAVGKSFDMVSKIVDFATSYAPKIIGAVIFYIIGSWIIKKIVGLIGKVMARKSYDASLQSFLMSLLKGVLLMFLVITIMGILGVDTGVFTAAIGGLGVAIGLALNGSLGNFAGGVMMLIFKPFRVGEMIEAQGVTGTVIEQGIFNTTVLTPDNKTAIVPNGPLSTNIITNYTTHGNLRVDLSMAVDPNTKIEEARRVATQAMLNHPKVLREPAPEVSVLKVADGMITLAIRPYTTQADYWDVYFGVQELVKNAWDAAGIAGPTPHRVIINKTA